MGVIFKRKGNHQRAIEFYEKSRNMNPKYPFNYLNLSAIYIEDKEYDKAIDILSQGLYNIQHADLYYNRACCHSICGNSDLAVSDLKRAIDLNSNIVEWIEKDKDFDNLRGHKGFKKLTED